MDQFKRSGKKPGARGSHFFKCIFCNVLMVVVVLLCACQQDSNVVVGQPRQLDSMQVAAYRDSLSQFFDYLLNTRGFSGGILVSKNGQVLYEHYQGVADAQRSPYTAETPTHVASTSKTFTSHAVFQMVEQGKIRLSDPVVNYLPRLPYPTVTIRQLLNHSSGIPNYAYLLPGYKWPTSQTATNYDVLRVLQERSPGLEFQPGSKFHYSNTNFVLLALVVEKVSGVFFPNYLRDSIFARCGMTHSYVVHHNNPGDFLPSWRGNTLLGYNYLDGIYGDKNVFTTCRDLLRYDSAIRAGVLLKANSYMEAWTPNFRDTKYRDTFEFYGLGWRLKVWGDTLKIPYHNGWWHGNNAVFQRVIADSAVIIVTGNRFMNSIYQAPLAANVFRKYFTKPSEEVDEDNNGNKKPKPVAKKKSKKVTKKKAPVKKKTR